MEYKCSRREFLDTLVKASAFACLGSWNAVALARGLRVTDMHSQLSEATPSKIVVLNTVPQAAQEIGGIARGAKGHLAICGSRHAAGGQEFATGAPLLDATGMSKVVGYDEERGTITVEAGIKWPELLDWLQQKNSPWTFRQKQTGNDRLTIGGTLSANAHGQGLRFSPVIGDVQSFRLLNADGKEVECNRKNNAELFALVIGGYGNFGLITTATLQLTRRVKYRRTIEKCTVKELPAKYRQAVAGGARYGDFQCDINEASDQFLRDGVWKRYQPVLPLTPSTPIAKASAEQWEELVLLAHTNKAAAWKTFSEGLLATTNAVEYNEFWQSSPYVDYYHTRVDERMGSKTKSTELLTELYVPLDDVHAFMEDARALLLARKTNMVYSTIRFAAKDDESFLPWSRTLTACVIFNLHTEHTPAGIEKTKEACQALIDAAIKYGGRYYLTYHRYARKDQVLKCYPEFVEFLRLKRKYDPRRVFRSDWYSFYEQMFASELRN
jgi:FAD/FMN-containing dehydrogenase